MDAIWYRLKIWTQQDERWLPVDHWAACGAAIDEGELRGEPYYGAVGPGIRNVVNVAKQEDAAGNITPSKAKSKQKIDGVVSLIMGIGVASLSSLAEESIYDTRGIRTL